MQNFKITSLLRDGDKTPVSDQEIYMVNIVSSILQKVPSN